MKRMDMHMHSIASDGCKDADQLIQEILEKNIGLFALTDHDTLDGVKEMMEKSAKEGLKCLPGVEVSSTYDGMEFHLLVYNFDWDNQEFLDLLKGNIKIRSQYDQDLIQALIESGTPLVSMAGYRNFEDDPYQGGWLSINYLKSIGLVKVFTDYIHLTHCLSNMKFPDPKTVINLAHKAGGLVVLAHPSSNQPGGLNNRILDSFLEDGIDGIECYSQYHKSSEEINYYVNYCRQHNLIVSGGSDYHGGFTGRRLGHPQVSDENADYHKFDEIDIKKAP